MNLGGRRYAIRAAVHTLGGYSAHADRSDLVDFIGGISEPPEEVVLVHGETSAKRALQQALEARFPSMAISIA